MRLIVGVLASLSVGGMSLALADPPAAPASSATSAAPAAAATTAAPAAPAEDAAQARRLRAAGYHSEMHEGNKVWCRAEVNTGSRLASGEKKCATAEQLDANARATQDALNNSLNLQTNKSGK
jgi:cytoskeletal protein RodZ